MNYIEAGQDLVKRYDINVIKVRRSMSGFAYYNSRDIVAPEPKTAKSFVVFAHEVGHVVNGKVRPRWKSEYMAEMFALDCFKEYDLKLPRIVKNRIKWHITYALAKAMNRGMKVIPQELKPYKKYLRPGYYIVRYLDGREVKSFRRWVADSSLWNKK